MPRRQITLEEIHDLLLFGQAASQYKLMPGIVQAYYPSSAGSAAATVDVQPATHDVRFDTTTGERISEPWPVLPRIPVGVLKFGGCAIRARLAAGDTVTLLGWDLDPSEFRTTGAASDPVDTRRHGGSYWVALPFDFTDPGALADPGGDVVVTLPSGAAMVIGDGSSDAPALASILDSFIKVFLDTWVPTPEDGGLALQTALKAWAMTGVTPPYTSTAATLLKLK